MLVSIVVVALVTSLVVQIPAQGFFLWVSARLWKIPDVTFRGAVLTSLVLIGANLVVSVPMFAWMLATESDTPTVGNLLLAIGALLVNIAVPWLVIKIMLKTSVVRAALAGLTTLIPVTVVSVILALIFRFTMLEAFVIPTGAMAPTLLGHHKNVTCPMCDYGYATSASMEMPGDPRTNVVATTCPLCRYTQSLQSATGDAPTVPTTDGDRILTDKRWFKRAAVVRWDTVIFRFPGNTRINYVKRLVGLPHEVVRIQHGDVFVRPLSGGELKIARKPPPLVRSLMHLVYDSHHVSPTLVAKNWPRRWQALPPHDAKPAWQEELVEHGTATRQIFSLAADDDRTHWLRYRHHPASEADWQRVAAGLLPQNHVAKPELVTDFFAYNTSQSAYEMEFRAARARPGRFGLHWVGDLMLECEAEVERPSGELLLELVEGGRRFGVHIDLATGRARLSIDDRNDFAPTAQTRMRTAGAYHIAFANVDDQLLLWVDDALVRFDGPTQYEPLENLVPVSSDEDPGDLAPAGVGGRRAAVRVTRLRVLRDVYYIAAADAPRGVITDYGEKTASAVMGSEEYLRGLLSDPNRWQAFARRRTVEFPMDADQFFFLGDNSPASKDGRLWPLEGLHHSVDRALLIGKARCTYWPPKRWKVVR